MSHINNEKIKGIIFLAAIISCFASFINKYPIVYPDTGTYIYSGFSNLVFDDRPIFYGIFLRHISLAVSLWLVVFVQGLLLSYIIFVTLGMFFGGVSKNYVFITIVCFLTLFTGFSYTVSIIIPDVFTSISVLCLVNLFLNKGLNKLQLVLISILFVFSICTQYSSIIIMFLLFLVFIFYFGLKKIKGEKVLLSYKRFLLSISLYLFCLLFIPSVNYLYTNQYKTSGASHVFIMNHLIETGVLNDYLKEKCDKNDFKICEYKDQLGWDFIWSPESPVQKTGGWQANKKEYQTIIEDVITTPKYFVQLLRKAIEYSFKQFFTFKVTISPPQLSSSPPFSQISWHFKDTVIEYMSSLQNGSKLNVDFLNALQQIVILVSIVILFVIILSKSLFAKLSFELKWLLVILLIHNLINSVVCSNFSTIDDRFQNRIVWLFPFCTIIIITKFYKGFKWFTSKNM